MQTPLQKSALLLVALPAVLFLLALNPWFSPEQHDDVTYFFGAKSIAESGTFQLDGIPITDWPPLFPLMLAAVSGSVLMAKLVVLGFIIAGLFAIRTLARNHAFQFPTTIAAITCLIPISLICGSNVLSEWPFLTLSFLFLLALQKLDRDANAAWILAAGTLLAAASLTRFAGVLLGVAIIAQAITKWRRSRSEPIKNVAPEALVAILGAVPWLLWKLRCQGIIARGEAPSGAYDQADYYLSRFSNFDIIGLFSQMEATLFSFVRALRPIVGSELVGGIIIAAFSITLIAGAFLQFRQHGIRPADWYVLANLLLLLGDLFQPERYFLPIAPFLIGYILVAVQAGAKKWSSANPTRTLVIFVTAWCALLITLDGYLLFVGNSDGTRGGLSSIASPDIESYYRKHHLDLYQALQYADGVAPASEPIGADGFHGKYALALSGRGFQNHPYGDLRAVHWLVQREDNKSTEPLTAEWQFVKQFGSHRVYQRKPQP